MLLKYLRCFTNEKDSKPAFKRQNTHYHKQSIIDVDNGTIEQIEIQNDNSNVIYEYLPNSAILHIYKNK